MSVSNYYSFFQAFVNTACLIAVAFQLGHVLQVTEILNCSKWLYPARALIALGLLLADVAPKWGGVRHFSALARSFFTKTAFSQKHKSPKTNPKVYKRAIDEIRGALEEKKQIFGLKSEFLGPKKY